MNAIELLAKLKERAVFSPLDVDALLGKRKGYAYLVLRRLEARGLVFRIENGRYTSHNDAFLVASRIVWPSYVSGWAAMQHHQLTEQIPSTIEVMTTRSRKKRKIKFMNVAIEFSRLAVPRFFGYEKTAYRGMPVFIATKEKAVLDAFFLKRLSPSEFKEIIKNNKGKISVRMLKQCAKRFSETFLSKVRRMVGGND